MRYENNQILREYLYRGAAGRSREHLQHPAFELDGPALAATIDEVRAQHPHLGDDEAEARAVFRLLTRGAPPEIAAAPPEIAAAPPEIAVEPPSRWHRGGVWTRRVAPVVWLWLRVLWAIAVLAALCAIAAHAEPDPDANAISVADRLHALEIRPPQLFQLSNGAARVQFQSSGVWSFVSSGNPFPITCISGCSAAGSFTDDTAFTVGSSAISPAGAYYTSGADPSLASGDAARIRMDAHSYLYVDCTIGCSGSSFSDNASFVAGSTPIGITGGWYSTSPTNCTSGSACAPQLTLDRKLFVQAFQGTSPWVVSQATAANLNATVVGTGTFAVQAAESGSWSVTANAGTNLNTSALALDTSVNGILNSQASTTAGEKGPLVQCAVTTNAPSYTTAQTDPLSCDTSGLTRVSIKDTPSNTNNFNVNLAASAATVTVSGTVAATESGNWTSRVVGNAGGVMDAAGQNATAPANELLGGCEYNSAPTTVTTGNITPTQCDSKGQTKTTIYDAAGNNRGANVDANNELNVSNATAANLNVRADTSGATAAAPPARADFIGGLGSGATGGEVIGVPVADTYKAINISTATTTLIVAGVSGRQVRISAQHIVAAGADNVAWIEGTGATCGTGTAGMAGGTTAASGYNFAANGGIAEGSGIGTVLATVTTGDSVCLVTSAAVQLSGGISYTIY